MEFLAQSPRLGWHVFLHHHNPLGKNKETGGWLKPPKEKSWRFLVKDVFFFRISLNRGEFFRFYPFVFGEETESYSAVGPSSAYQRVFFGLVWCGSTVKAQQKTSWTFLGKQYCISLSWFFSNKSKVHGVLKDACPFLSPNSEYGNSLEVNHHFRTGNFLLDDDYNLYYKTSWFARPTYKKWWPRNSREFVIYSKKQFDSRSTRSTPHPGFQSPPGLWTIFSRESL